MTSIMSMSPTSPLGRSFSFFSDLSRRASGSLSPTTTPTRTDSTGTSTLVANPKVALSGLPFKSLLQVRALFVPFLEHQLDKVTRPTLVFDAQSKQWKELKPSHHVKAARTKYRTFLKDLDTEADRRLRTYRTTPEESQRIAQDPVVRPLYNSLYGGKKVSFDAIPMNLDGLSDFPGLCGAQMTAEIEWRTQEQDHILRTLTAEAVSGYDATAFEARLGLLWDENERGADAIARALEDTEEFGTVETLQQAESLCATAALFLDTLRGRCAPDAGSEERETYANVQYMDMSGFSTKADTLTVEELANATVDVISRSINQVTELRQADLIDYP